MRTYYLDPNLNTPHYPACGVCGKKCSHDTKHKVWSANCLEAVHPEDIDEYNIKRGAESGPCALLTIGPECAKMIPQEFIVET